MKTKVHNKDNKLFRYNYEDELLEWIIKNDKGDFDVIDIYHVSVSDWKTSEGNCIDKVNDIINKELEELF